MSTKPKKQSQVPGLTLIDPLQLPPEFRKFKNDELFYISHCLFYPNPPVPGDAPAASTATSGSSKSSEPLKPIQRVIALTPAAIFVTDTNGVMERATRLEMIDSVYHEHVVIKKFFGSEECMHVIIKIPSECDVHVSFDKNPHVKNTPFIAVTDLCEVMRILVNFRRNSAASARFDAEEFRVIDLKTNGGGKSYKDVMNDKPPVGFLSPKEIIAQNSARDTAVAKIDAVSKESLQLEEAVKALEAAVESKSRELRTLESSLSVDTVELNRQRDILLQQNKEFHRLHNAEELEVFKLRSDAAAMAEQLREARERREDLIKQQLTTDGGETDEKHKEVAAMRKKQQIKEIDRANDRLATLKAQCQQPLRLDGLPHLVQRAKQLEDDIQKQLDVLERDLESSIKIEKFLDQSVAELKGVNDKLSELQERKLELLNKRAMANKPPPPPAASAPPTTPSKGGGPLDDDDLLGGGSPAPPSSVAPPAASSAMDDDDLLGGGPGPSAGVSAPATSNAPSTAATLDDDDDDLLGGGSGVKPPPAAVPPSTSAAVGDDLF